MDVELREAGREDTPVLLRLMQLYPYDLGTIDGWDVVDDGLYGTAALMGGFWTDPKRRSCLVRVGGRLAGFVLIRDRAPLGGEGTRQVSGVFRAPRQGRAARRSRSGQAHRRRAQMGEGAEAPGHPRRPREPEAERGDLRSWQPRAGDPPRRAPDVWRAGRAEGPAGLVYRHEAGGAPVLPGDRSCL